MCALLLKKDVQLNAKHSAFEFQRQAVDFMEGRDYGAIFHEQGLGKTKIAIDIILQWLQEDCVDSVIVFTKKGLVANWKREFINHTYIKPAILTQDRKSNFFAFNVPARVYISHYEVMNSELARLKLFQRARRIGVILDESHKIKNPSAKITMAAFDLSPGFAKRIIMSGTPIPNRPYDIWAQIYFLDGGKSLGNDYKNFRLKYDFDPDLSQSDEKKKLFSEYLASLFNNISAFSIRENKKSGIIKLPNKTIYNIYCEWESAQKEIYNSIRNELRAIVVKRGVPTEDNAEPVLKRMLRLVQVASNPLLVDESYEGEPGKLPILVSLIQQQTDIGEKSIIWTSFTENADWLNRLLTNYGALKLHGKMSIADRNRSVERFLTEADRRVLVATPAAAKEGLTLTVANNVIFYDRGFSLDDYLQAQDRIHRISQEKECNVYNLVMANSIDEWVDALLEAKKIAAQLAQGDISAEEFEGAISYEFQELIREILGIGS